MEDSRCLPIVGLFFELGVEGLGMLGQFLMAMWEKLVKLVPRYVAVEPDSKGCLLRCGRVRKVVGPGLYWLLPIVDDCSIVSVVSQVVDLPDVSVQTKDRVAVVASGVVSYKIRDVEKALYKVLDYDDAIRTIGSACLSEAVGKLEWKERVDRPTMEAEMEEELQELVKEWGITVELFVLNRLIETVGVDLTIHKAGLAGGREGEIGTRWAD